VNDDGEYFMLWNPTMMRALGYKLSKDIILKNTTITINIKTSDLIYQHPESPSLQNIECDLSTCVSVLQKINEKREGIITSDASGKFIVNRRKLWVLLKMDEQGYSRENKEKEEEKDEVVVGVGLKTFEEKIRYLLA